MSAREEHIHHLFEAEIQFRLISAVRIAVTNQRQPLDLPMDWTHSQQEVQYEEIALRQDQAEYAAAILQRSATYSIAMTVKDAIEAIVPELSDSVRNAKGNIDLAIRRQVSKTAIKPWKTTDEVVITAYHIARLIRNAFAHAPFAPAWMISFDLQDRRFSIQDVIDLNTMGLNKTPAEWKHYGGLLSLFRFCRFTRIEILGDSSGPRKSVPLPKRRIHQFGGLVLEETIIPEGAVRITLRKNPDGSVDLGRGYSLRVDKKKK